MGQGAFIRLVAASGRVVSLNVLEANGILLGLSHLGNGFAGSRMRRVVGATGAAAAAATTTEVRRNLCRHPCLRVCVLISRRVRRRPGQDGLVAARA